MWLKIREVGYLEVDFWHTHDRRCHRHDAVVADPEAHWMAHRLDRVPHAIRSGVTRSYGPYRPIG